MKFGLSFLPDASPETKSPEDYFSEAIKLCSLAEEAEFHTIKMTEHYLHPYGGYCPSPLIFLTAIAARTRKIRLMTGCILPAFHHPIQIAAETALLDCLSSGRLDVGFGRAYLPYEFEAFGIDLDNSRERYTKTIQAVLDLWKNPKTSCSTEYFSFENATSFPTVNQKPHPPVWGAAVNSRQSFAWLGEQGFNLLISAPFGGIENILPFLDIYRSSFAEHNPLKSPKIAVSLPLIINELHERAIEQSDLYLARYLNTWASATKEWNTISSRDYPKYHGMSNLLLAASPETMRKNHQAIVGCPEYVLEKVHFLKELLNIDQIMWQIDFGSQPFEISQKSLELFAKDVMPAILYQEVNK